ncbi:NADH-quinone oxidoreductase subunit NuoE [Tianweitania sp. BSSL-BM11]|uniref:NADH-quinone oxidoreductase subunit NuoE n=1 Tax=Tianweitania aestuarii TaxID=2814886 RepID=A0ABS5RX62_9HYPH|nr:NADH-quinone oxidoreductase subunit NuoE [Tianweitania aestuarii]MBS9720267.1 NADH-quinone oxidoreductase subunit NuoE [Tianweitania aestuarii]
MSVRRLAEPAVQPASFAFNEENAAWADRAIAKYPEGRQQSAVIPLLMRAQEQEGWVSKAAIETVADMLGMPYIRVLEVATFYTQYQLKPVGTKGHVQVCGTTPCMVRGAGALMDVCRSKIHHDQFHTNESGTLSWEEVECLGACVNAPMVMVFKDTYEDLTPDRLAEIIDAFEAGNPPQPGPQIDRFYSAPASGFTSLTDEQAIQDNAREWREKRKQAWSAEAAPATGETAAPPSEAARPKTDAAETNPTIKSPSPEKTNPAAERADSVKAPTGNAAEANKADPSVEGEAKQRKNSTEKEGDESLKAPELFKEEPVGADAKGEAASDADTTSAGKDMAGHPDAEAEGKSGSKDGEAS